MSRTKKIFINLGAALYILLFCVVVHSLVFTWLSNHFMQQRLLINFVVHTLNVSFVAVVVLALVAGKYVKSVTLGITFLIMIAASYLGFRGGLGNLGAFRALFGVEGASMAKLLFSIPEALFLYSSFVIVIFLGRNKETLVFFIVMQVVLLCEAIARSITPFDMVEWPFLLFKLAAVWGAYYVIRKWTTAGRLSWQGEGA